MTLKELITSHLKTTDIMQLATVRDGQPWCCTVHFLPDENLNLYWLSTPSRRHSQEIRDDARVAAAMAIQSAPGKPVIGVQVEGDARRVTDHETIKKVMRQYVDRHGKDEQWHDEVVAGRDEHLLYCLQPRLYTLFDQQNFPEDPRQEWQP